jgi:hypothetical protein
MVRSCSVVAAFLLLSACSGAGPGQGSQAATSATAPADGGGGAGQGGGTGGAATGATLTVMTRNLYLGADIRRLAAATQASEIPAAAGGMYRMIRATDFFSRAEALADEIATASPHLVALEEVSLYRTGDPNACEGLEVPATEVWLDFLQMLQDALAARSADYAVAGTVQNFDAQLCTQVSSETYADVRLTDRDVILVRGDLAFANARSGSFVSRAELPAGGTTLPIPRGWASVDVASPIGDVRFAVTHLEVEGFASVQQAQAAELVAAAGKGLGTLPLIVAGDFNAGPELAGVTTTYADLLDAGYMDPWPALFPGDAGPTCCFDEDLLGGSLTQRIDLTLYQGSTLVPLDAERVGLSQNTEPGLYPSDHAGVITTFGVSSGGGGGGECPPDDSCTCECHCCCEHDHDHCDRDRDHDDCGHDGDHGHDRCDHDRDHCDRDRDRDHGDCTCHADGDGEGESCDEKSGGQACGEKQGGKKEGKDSCREHRGGDCHGCCPCHCRCDRDGKGEGESCDEKSGGQGCGEKRVSKARATTR